MTTDYKTAVSFYRAFVGFSIYTVFRFCSLCVGVCDIIIRKLITENRQSTGKSAQYGRILWKQKHFEMNEPSPSDFRCFFSSRVNPDSVLQPNVSLYAITSKEAFFVETPENINIYSSNVHPFCFVAQFLYAKNVITMSITEFVGLAERIGDPAVPVIWMSNTGRCGGTMLGQVLESVPGTLFMNEPHSLQNMCHLQERGTLNDSQYDDVLKSIIRVLSKPRHGIKSICIKPHPICTVMMKDITRLLPKIKQLFIYRNSLNTIKSLVGAMQCESFFAVMNSCANTDWFSALCPYFRHLERYQFVSKAKYFDEIPDDANTAGMFAYMWSYFILIARDAMSRDQNILPVKYEDIIARPKEVVRQLFDRIDIAAIHLDNAVTSMEHDSQRQSVLSRDRLESSKYISTVDKIRIDSILSKFNLPLLDKDFRI